MNNDALFNAVRAHWKLQYSVSASSALYKLITELNYIACRRRVLSVPRRKQRGS